MHGSFICVGPSWRFHRLLLVHGVWCYDRVCKVALYMVYKQLVLNGTLFLYNAYNGMSGTSLYDSVMIIMYSMVYTFLPVLVVGCLDQPVRASTAYNYPQAYHHGQANKGFSLRVVCLWAADAVLHAAAIFYLTLGASSAADLTFAGVSRSDGREHSLLVFGTTLHLMVVLVTNLKLALAMNMHSRLQLAVIAVCVLSWFGVELAWDVAQPFLQTTVGIMAGADYYGCFITAVTSPTFWLSIPLVAIGALLVDLTVQAYHIASRPTLMDTLRAVDRMLACDEMEDAAGEAGGGMDID